MKKLVEPTTAEMKFSLLICVAFCRSTPHARNYDECTWAVPYEICFSGLGRPRCAVHRRSIFALCISQLDSGWLGRQHNTCDRRRFLPFWFFVALHNLKFILLRCTLP